MCHVMYCVFSFIINDKIHTTLLLWSVVHVSQQRYVSLYISEKKYLSEICFTTYCVSNKWTNPYIYIAKCIDGFYVVNSHYENYTREHSQEANTLNP